jgi:hypothetical protein
LIRVLVLVLESVEAMELALQLVVEVVVLVVLVEIPAHSEPGPVWGIR